MPKCPQNEDFDKLISVELAGEKYTVPLEKWIHFVSVDQDNMLQFLQENDSSRCISLPSARRPPPVASESSIIPPGKSREKPSYDPTCS
jgi:hypothetical protein